MKSRGAWLYLGAWVVFDALYSVMLLSTVNTSFADAQAAAFFTVTPAALMGLLVWRVARRVKWNSSSASRIIALHTAGAIVYALVWAGFTAAQIEMFAPHDAFVAYVARAFGWQVMMGLMMYGLIAGVAYVVEASENLAEQKTLAARAELQALRSQLNPHFLFNTLHSITSLVQESPAQAENALVKFGTLLRYVLHSSGRKGDDATLDEELEFVRGYLSIEKMRLGDRLTIVENVEAEALECTLPVLTLQPIVENAIEHGIAQRAEGGTVSIAASLNDNRLLVLIRDDGVGANAADFVSSNGFGLSLVEKRLRLRFGDAGSLRVETSRGSGASVSISVPAS